MAILIKLDCSFISIIHYSLIIDCVINVNGRDLPPQAQVLWLWRRPRFLLFLKLCLKCPKNVFGSKILTKIHQKFRIDFVRFKFKLCCKLLSKILSKGSQYLGHHKNQIQFKYRPRSKNQKGIPLEGSFSMIIVPFSQFLLKFVNNLGPRTTDLVKIWASRVVHKE